MTENAKGFTLVEVMIGIAITVTLFGSMIAAFIGVKSLNMMARHKMQAMQVVRGQVENLKATPFTTLAGGTATAAIDAGPNGTFGNSDDLNGTLTTTLQDRADFDNDGNTAETSINVDAQGGNDAVAVPVRVSLAWNEHVLGATRAMSVSVDTIIAQ